MEDQFVNIKCDKQMKLLLPILQDRINNQSLSSDISDDSFESSDFEIDGEELDSRNVIFLLNTLGQTYLSKDGFNDEEPIQFSDKFDSDLISSFIEESKEEDYYIEETIDGKFDIEIDFFVDKSLIPIKQSKVIINYNSKNIISCEYDEKWIKIDDENSQVIISGKDKKIILYDILYATQCIATTYDKTNFIVEINEQEYEILDINDDILILKY